MEVSLNSEALANVEEPDDVDPVEEVHDGVSSPRVKRRRLSGKQASPLQSQPAPSVPAPEPVVPVEVVVEDAAPEALDVNELRRRLLARYGYWWRRKHQWSSLRGIARTSLAGKYNLRLLDIPARSQRLAEYLLDHPSDSEVVERVSEKNLDCDLRDHVAVRDAFFLTWNGDWGALGSQEHVVAMKAAGPGGASPVPAMLSGGASSGSPGEVQAVPSGTSSPVPNACCPTARVDPEYEHKQVRKVVAMLQTMPQAAAIRAELERFLERLGNFCPGLRFAWAVEVCPRTLAEQCCVRLHAHAFCKLKGKCKIPKAMFEFMGSPAHFSDALASAAFVRSRNLAAGLYYLQAPKVCSVFSGGSQVPHQDYGVTAKMVLMMVQGNKMDYSAARAELAKIPVGIVSNLQCLERWYRERCDAKLEELTLWHRKLLAAEQRPWRQVPLVNVWLEQYRAPQARFKFLVLDGPSRMGKTLFARSLCADGDVLELNMAGGAQADLRAYSEA